MANSAASSTTPKKLSPLNLPMGREFKGGDLLAQCLRQLGVLEAFGLHGGHLDAFLMGAHDAGIRLIDTRHETVAVQAAEGYSKVSGEVGVCFFTANSGFSNAMPGLATAFADRSSIFCITSSSPQRDIETNVLQGFHDQIVLSKPITRFNCRVSHAEEIPRLVAHAFRVAVASPPGPVLIDFPIEVLFAPVDQAKISYGSIIAPFAYPPAPHFEALSEAEEMIRAAKRPVIITSTGARRLASSDRFSSFIQHTRIPVFNSSKFSGSLPFDHPMRAGRANLLFDLPSDQKPDLALLLGVRTGMFMGGRSESLLPFPDICKYIQVDVDSGEIGRSQHIDLGITSDVLAFIELLDQKLTSKADGTGYQAPHQWVERVLELKVQQSDHDNESTEPEPGKVHPYFALKYAFSALPKDSILIVDGGEISSWSITTSEFARASRVIYSTGYLGFLGNGWGYALGASAAEPTKLVVNIQGDGSAGLHLAELDTYARFGARILTIISNNHCWGMSANGQELIYGSYTKARPAAALSPAMDFSVVAKGLGCLGEKVSKASEVEQLTRYCAENAAAGRPACLEIVTSTHPIHPGTVAMVGDSKDPNVVVIPYYDNVPRPFYNN